MGPIKNIRNVMAVAVTGAIIFGAGVSIAEQMDQILKVEDERTKIAQSSQATIDQLSEQTSQMLNEYRDVLKQIETLQAYNAQIERLVSNQSQEITSLNSQIDNVTVIDRQISPLMLRMIDSLDQFVSLDIPFLTEERTNRIEILRSMMDSANVENSEKFRRLLEAFQIENEYGRTIDAYQADLELGGKTRKVNYLQIGRIVLLYQTLDLSETGIWNPKSKSWDVLPDSYRSAVRQGLRIARGQVQPDLLRLPIPAPEAVQ